MNSQAVFRFVTPRMPERSDNKLSLFLKKAREPEINKTVAVLMTVASGQSSGGPGIFQLIRIMLFGMPSTVPTSQATFFTVVEPPTFMKLVSRGVKSNIPLLALGLSAGTELG